MLQNTEKRVLAKMFVTEDLELLLFLEWHNPG
jgi:hypothetical protein